MDCAPDDIATTLAAWLRHLAPEAAVPPAPTFAVAPTGPDVPTMVGTLAALAAEALARNRTLQIVTADDHLLPEISNALDLRLRPLCLVLPGADHASHIALRATLALLKSRLTTMAHGLPQRMEHQRHGCSTFTRAADSDGPAWTALRAKLRQEDALWRASLAWMSRGIAHEAPPAGTLDLFPVRIGPLSIAQRSALPTDWVVLVQSGRLPASLCTAWPGVRHTLMLSAQAFGEMTGLVPIDETVRLRAELEVLGQELAELELELATAQGELAAFSARYHELIVGRMAELDRIHADLAQARMRQQPDDPGLGAAAREAAARATQSRREREAFEAREAPSQGARFAPNDDLKKRFRHLAQKIHPDRASDEADRAWRTQLMSEANRAYRAGDAAALEELLSLWLEGQRAAPARAVRPHAQAAPGSASLQELTAQLAAVRQRIAAITTELDRLYGSKLYELFAAARMAMRHGRDLIEEMAQRLDLQIAQAQAELDLLG